MAFKKLGSWLSLSFGGVVSMTLALFLATAASASEIFLDEGDGDFSMVEPANTDLEPKSQSEIPEDLLKMADAYASEPVTAEAPEKAVDVADPAPSEVAVQAVEVDESVKSETQKQSMQPAQKAVVTKAAAQRRVAKKKEQRAVKKAIAKKSSAKKALRQVAKGSKKSQKGPARKVASFAGGTYQVAKKNCDMSSTPGGKAVVGSIKMNRKIWVENAGTKTYRVYNRSGEPAFVRKSCF